MQLFGGRENIERTFQSKHEVLNGTLVFLQSLREFLFLVMLRRLLDHVNGFLNNDKWV